MANSELPGDPFSDLLTCLPFIDTLEDCDIPAVRYYKLSASCSQHGSFTETWDRDPGAEDTFLLCLHCSFAGVTKKCPIRGLAVMGEGYVPE